VSALTAADMDEILIGTSSCGHLSSLLRLQASRLKGALSRHILINQQHFFDSSAHFQADNW